MKPALSPMKRMTALLLALGLALALPAAAESQSETVSPKFNQAIPNVPGKSFIAVEVVWPPGGKSAPHRHAKSAFIFAYVLSGAIKSQVEGEPAKIYRAGETWYEVPGAHHIEAENASTTEPARLLAIFVADTDDKVLTTPDK